MRSTSGYLEVVVPPAIVESQTSQMAEVAEHANVSLQCRATGHPKPSISWRREDGNPIKLNGHLNYTTTAAAETYHSAFPTVYSSGSSSTSSLISVASSHQGSPATAVVDQQQPQTITMSHHLNDVKSDRLSFYNVDRSMGGVYICSASNGIPTQAIKRIPLIVKFAPKTSVANKYISVSLGDQLEVDCLIEAHPKANSYWSKTSLPLPQPYRLESAKWSQQFMGDTSRVSANKRKLAPNPPDTNQGEDNQQRHTNLSSIDTNSGALETSIAGSRQRFVPKLSHRILPHDPQYSDHPHNRIQIRQTDLQHMMSAELPAAATGSGAQLDQQTQTVINAGAIEGPRGADSGSSGSSRAYVTVKQTTVNPYTVKLKMTIGRVQADDYGHYYCIATNHLGSAESLVIVTKADKVEKNRSPASASGFADYPSSTSETSSGSSGSDNVDNSKSREQQQQGVSRQTGNRIVYDTNYLQAIKTRQNNVVSSSKLQQKLRLRQYSDRSSGHSHLHMGPTTSTGYFLLIEMLFFSLIAYNNYLIVV